MLWLRAKQVILGRVRLPQRRCGIDPTKAGRYRRWLHPRMSNSDHSHELAPEQSATLTHS
jgi:hypothetical protein